jgi:hypothetical protein
VNPTPPSQQSTLLIVGVFPVQLTKLGVIKFGGCIGVIVRHPFDKLFKLLYAYFVFKAKVLSVFGRILEFNALALGVFWSSTL